MKTDTTAKNYKELRFNALSQAYQSALANFDLVENVNFDFLKKEIENLNHYKKLDLIAKYLIELFHQETDEKFWKVYEPSLRGAERRGNDGKKINWIYEKEHVNFAVRNAFFGYIAIINLIPKLYKRQFGREIQPDEYKLASLNSINLIYKLSKFHFDVFRAFIYATSQKDHGVNSDLHVFRLDRFQFDENMNIELSKKAHAEIKLAVQKIAEKGKLRTDQPTIGCPALQVYDNDGQDMIQICFDWVIVILDKLEIFNLNSR